MTQYIVDASVVVQRLIYDTHTANAKALFRHISTMYELYIPEFCLLECTNVLWKQVRFHGMSKSNAEVLIDDLSNLPFMIIPATSLLKRGLQIGLLHQLAVYDSVYIALAEHLGYPLITTDARQEQAAKASSIPIKPITDFA